ncbi:hypothetical protein nbrc107696_43860 [Gordonia spumicola]|uniref:Cyclodehydratase n=1 Tax=Gordonia spumicola TaxID=589161 RepID=A0A7I9VG07_9ACTN|nr:hypothetical protein [Gordonia spumicola]GEE03940.1 hypothetical protein nbrc107696_43860 [Gordonia spumicola]
MTDFANDPGLPVLLPGYPVVARRDGTVQVGCDPGTSVLLEVGARIAPRAVASLLQTLREPADYPSIARRVRSVGLDARSLRAMLDRLVAAGCAVPTDRPTPRTLSVHIIGRGDVARDLASSLTGAGIVVDDAIAPGLIVLADQPVVDPRITRRLMSAGYPHMPVHLRDGLGVVGPLVLPGTSSCLRCADMHLTDFDPQWPVVAAGLLDVVGHADPAVLRATVAVAHAQLDETIALLTADDGPAPSLVGRTLEFRTGPSRLASHIAPVHPRCGCTARSATAA